MKISHGVSTPYRETDQKMKTVPIRPFTEADLPQVIDLNRRVFPLSAGLPKDTQREAFIRLCLRNPWYDPSVSSLVYQDERGKVVGFLAVVPRRLSLDGQPIRLAVSQHLMVEPSSRTTLAGMELLRAFLAGPQDLSMADMANDLSRKLWERLGGVTSLIHSLYWHRPLRPVSLVQHYLSHHQGIPAALSPAARPLCRAVDALVNRLPYSPFRFADPDLSGEELTTETLLECLSRYDKRLRPEYNTPSLQWLLDTISRETRYGHLHKTLVRNKKQDIIGWYMYYFNRDGISRVLQIGTLNRKLDDVLDHLFYHAWRQGAISLFGRLEPDLMQTGTRKFGFVSPGQYWMLIHSRHPELLQAVRNGEAFLSRMEGDLNLL